MQSNDALVSMPELEKQVRLSKMLAMGFGLSFHGVAGLGSLVALGIGLKALKTINRSSTNLAGKWMAWWRIIADAIGAIAVLPHTLPLFIRSN